MTMMDLIQFQLC